jgi:hypothetical protein
MPFLVWRVSLSLPRVSADKEKELLVSSAALNLSEVHFYVFKKYGACCLYPKAWLKSLT